MSHTAGWRWELRPALVLQVGHQARGEVVLEGQRRQNPVSLFLPYRFATDDSLSTLLLAARSDRFSGLVD